MADFDPQTRTGTLLLDDGRRLEFDAAAFDASGLRLLRLGQRVQVEHTADEHGEPGEGTEPGEGAETGGRVSRISLPTMQGWERDQ